MAGIQLQGLLGWRRKWLGIKEKLFARQKGGRSQGVMARLKQWLQAKGLTRNEAKTRLVNIRQEEINFLGFNLPWRRSLQGRGYLHVAPGQKSRRHLREKLGGILNHWTRGRSIQEVATEAIRVLRGWAGYVHYGNSVTVMNRMKHYSQTGSAAGSGANTPAIFLKFTTNNVRP